MPGRKSPRHDHGTNCLNNLPLCILARIFVQSSRLLPACLVCRAFRDMLRRSEGLRVSLAIKDVGLFKEYVDGKGGALSHCANIRALDLNSAMERTRILTADEYAHKFQWMVEKALPLLGDLEALHIVSLPPALRTPDGEVMLAQSVARDADPPAQGSSRRSCPPRPARSVRRIRLGLGQRAHTASGWVSDHRGPAVAHDAAAGRRGARPPAAGGAHLAAAAELAPLAAALHRWTLWP